MDDDDYEAVIRTNDDATECRWSAVQAGLLASSTIDIRFLSRKPRVRSPIINRGTFIRTRYLDEFFAHQQGQIVLSVGAGFDIRPLRFPQLTWVEVDLPEVIQCKRMHLPDYPARLISADLNSATLKENADILLVECVFPYLQSRRQIAALVSGIAGLKEILLFEPVALNDPFGIKFMQNVQAPMPSLFKDLSTLATFYHGLGFTVKSAYTLDSAPLSEESRRLLAAKGGLDEYEEWQLMSRHYYFVHLVKDKI